MKFYEINLHSVPELIFAYSVSSDRYKNRFPSYENLLEVSVIESGTIYYEHDDGSRSETPPGTVAPILKDARCRTYAEHGVLQKHITVGAVADYTLIPRDTEAVLSIEALRERVFRNGTILIPYQWDLGRRYGEIADLLREIIYAYSAMHPTHLLDALSKWFHLMSVLTGIVLSAVEGRALDVQSPATEYVKKAELYIAQHYAEHITVSELAEHLGLSAGYLHGIFKQYTGMRIVEYINRYRIRTVKEYLKSHPLSLKEAAYRVGIDDPAYMSRLFKKVEGISFRAYTEKR